jgi:hypothetical protein
MNEPNLPDQDRFKLAPNFYALWGVLLFIVATKILLLRPSTAGDFLHIVIFGAILLAVPYAAARAVWTYGGRVQRRTEIVFLAVMVVLFLIQTIALYQEGFAE